MKKEKALRFGAISLALTTVVAASALLWKGSSEESDPLSDKTARETCREAVLERLRAPSTAKFVAEKEKSRVFKGIGHLNAEVFVVVDAENAFGAMVRETYKCELYDKNRKWEPSHVLGLG